MDLRHLRYFMTLAKSRSLHSAARDLKLRQPALSQSIRALEAHVGTLLIERRPTGIRLTPAGAVFLKDIAAILGALERAVGSARLTAQAAASLRLGIGFGMELHRLADQLTAFQRHTPVTPLLIIDGSPARLLSMLDAGLLDLALLPAAALPHTGGSIALWEVPLHLAVPISHPLSAELMVSLHQLADVPVVLGNEQYPGSADQVLLAACHAAGVALPVAARVHDAELRFILVRAGAGVTALPAPQLGLNRDGIVVRPVSPALTLAMAAAWPANGLTDAARQFLDLAWPPIST